MSIHNFKEKKYLKVLVLEDSLEDAELMIDELLNHGYLVEHVIADNRNDFSNHIHYFMPHLILSDYNLPEFNGYEALSVAIDSCPETPFIFVTGTVGEEIAAETILNGASGLVLKSNLNKLPESVENAFQHHRKWSKKRIERISNKIHTRVNKNIEALQRIQTFLERNGNTENVNDILSKTLDDLNKLTNNNEESI